MSITLICRPSHWRTAAILVSRNTDYTFRMGYTISFFHYSFALKTTTVQFPFMKKKSSHEERTLNLCSGNAFNNSKQCIDLQFSILDSTITWSTNFFLEYTESWIITTPNEYQNLPDIIISQQRKKSSKEKRANKSLPYCPVSLLLQRTDPRNTLLP